MTPELKAKELLEKFEDIKTLHFWAEYENNNILLINQAKICALIAVDELLEYENRMLNEWTRYFEGKCGQMKIERLYWQEVKQEINKL